MSLQTTKPWNPIDGDDNLHCPIDNEAGCNRLGIMIFRSILAAASIGLLTLVGCSSGSQRLNAAEAPPADVGVMTVQPRTISIYRSYVAHIKALYTVDLHPRVFGELTSYHFRGGEKVHKGKLLFQIDPAPYQIALQSAEAQLEKSKSDLAQSEAKLRKAQKDVERYKPLAKIHAIPEQDLMDAEAAEQVQNAVLKQSRAEVLVQKSAVSQAKLNLAHTKIYAPITGIIGQREIDPGNLVSATDSTPLATVSSSDPMLVTFSISDVEYMKYFAPHSSQRVEPTDVHYELLLADGTQYKHPGKFLYVNRALNEQTDTLTVVLSFPNPDQILKPGGYARIRADIEHKKDTLLIPVIAVQTIQGIENVLLVNSKNKVVQRTITTLIRQGENYVVDEGLKPGDRVVVQGQQKLEPGDSVSPHAVALDAGS